MKIAKFIAKIAVPTIGVIAGVAALPIAIILTDKFAKKEHYNFGLAVPTVNSLNYIKYSDSVGRVAGSLMEGPIANGPTGELKNQLQLQSFKSDMYIMTYRGAVSATAYPLSDEGLTSGSLALGSKTKSYVSILDKNGKVTDVFLRLNNKSSWRSGDKKWDASHARLVKGQDYVDSMKAILNLKNSSQLLTGMKNLHIKGVSESYNAQFAYYVKNHKIYKTPFDGKLKKDGSIGKSDFELGVTSGKKSLEKEKIGKTKQTGLDLAETMVPKSERDDKGKWADSIIHYRFSTPSEFTTFLTKLRTPLFFPINKEFIEDHGGLGHFGDSIKNFIWNGAFDINSLILGSQGSMVLKKSQKYWGSGKVIPDKIKLYFQGDKVVKSALFDDGKISYTEVPAVYQMKFWSDPEKRKYMHKNVGAGTIALSLNLDEKTNSNSPLQDPDLRKAMSYAIDRQRTLKYAGLDSSFPVVSWTAFGGAKDTKGRNIETHWNVYKDSHGKWSGETFKAESGKEFPIQNSNWSDHANKSHSFEHMGRNDSGFDPKTAKFFIEKYKKNHPNRKNVKLTYVDRGTNEAKNMFIGLQNLMRKQFGDYIILEERTVPENVFVQYHVTGKFDLIYDNFDKYGMELSSYIKRFLIPDGIGTNPKKLKTTGFRQNPAGSWTYTDFRNREKKKGTWNQLKNRLHLSDEVWDKLNELIPAKMPESTIEQEKIMINFEKFFSSQTTNATDAFTTETAAAFEKLIRVSAPIIPLMEVDTYWYISRIMGAGSLDVLSLKYAYDVENKPRPELPGIEKD